MRIRRWLLAVPLAGAAGLGILADSFVAAGGAGKQDDPRPAVSLPVTRVVLFNSGVGYFARSGEVDGEARVDLTFPASDVDDLLKSMTLEDAGGTVTGISYDSHEPVARTLSSFAVDLSSHPSLADILTQTRGEKVEVVMQPGVVGQPGSLQGTVVGVENQKVPTGQTQLDVKVLTIAGADGLRSVKMMDVARVRFTNPALEAEMRRALDTLALSHDTRKKAVQLGFSGAGRRKVRVGYVLEAPVWKTSYRLVLGGDGKPTLQSWAMVENPTDEDWTGVGMALVSGRPISFRMDLYNSLYVPRPMVEPELFASLRPQAYEGGYAGREKEKAGENKTAGKPSEPRAAAAPAPAGPGATNGAEFRGGGGGFGMAKDAAMRKADRDYASNMGKELDQRMDMGAVASVATADKLGDGFRYTIDHPVSLGRQKSALLPILTKEVEGTRVSIYNPAVQAKHPLLGLRFKNTTGAHLSQGPITVFDGSTYAGDSRILDVVPGDERLIAYAVDLGTEVIPQTPAGTSRVTTVKAVKGIVSITRRVREEKVYKASNKGEADRLLLIEHPNRTNQQFKLVDTAKPVEETPALYRFETKLEAGKSLEFKVAEERDQGEQVILSNAPDDTIRFVMSLGQASPALKAKLADALKAKHSWDEARREAQHLAAEVARITADQDRIRNNLGRTPKESEVYQEYLKKLGAQEKEMDALTAKQKAAAATENASRKAFDDFLLNLTD